MKVILLEKVYNLGNLGDTVNVKPGYARNFLIPYGKAVMATKENLEKFESRRAELEKAAADLLTEAEKRADAFKDVVLELTARAKEEGALFGSVGVREIVDALAAKSLEVERKEVLLPNGPLHEVGEFEIELVFHSDVIVPVKVIITAEG